MHLLVIARTLAAVIIYCTITHGAPPNANDMSNPKIGQLAPPLDFERLLQAPDDAKVDWDSLKGKVVVLEFWATWCAPCIQMIPDLNKLKGISQGKPVLFISITDEDESTVGEFLKKTSKSGWIGLDTNGSVFRSYGIHGRPRAALVDREGKLVGWTDPGRLIEHPEILTDLVAGKRPAGLATSPRWRNVDLFGDIDRELAGLGESDSERPLCLILIRPAKPQAKRTAVGGSNREFRWDATTMRDALVRLYDLPGPQIISDAQATDNKKYDIVFRWFGGSYDRGRGLLREAVEGTFGLSTRCDKRMMDVYVLHVAEGAEPNLKRAISRLAYDQETRQVAPTKEVLNRMKAGDTFLWALGDTEELAKHLGHLIGRPVVDEARIDGYYDFHFPCDLEAPDLTRVVKTLREKYGLTLTPGRREVDVLIVTRTPRPDGEAQSE